MRSLILLALLALPAHAQVPGSAFCQHTRTDEKLILVRVALIEAGSTEDGRQYPDPVTLKGVPPVSQMAVFKPAPAATSLIGMRLTCEWLMPSPGKRSVIPSTYYWETPIPIPPGAVPKLSVSVVETSPGLWRAYIGKAP